MYSGWSLVVMSKFEIEKFCATIQNQKITFAYVVPPVVLLLGKHPIVDKYNLSSLKMLNSGAAPLTRELVDAVYQRLNVPIKQGYGLSETSPTTHAQVSAHHFMLLPLHLQLVINGSRLALGGLARYYWLCWPPASQPNGKVHVPQGGRGTCW